MPGGGMREPQPPASRNKDYHPPGFAPTDTMVLEPTSGLLPIPPEAPMKTAKATNKEWVPPHWPPPPYYDSVRVAASPPESKGPKPTDETFRSHGLVQATMMLLKETPKPVLRAAGIAIIVPLTIAITGFVLQINIGSTINKLVDRQNQLGSKHLEAVRNNTNALTSVQENINTLVNKNVSMDEALRHMQTQYQQMMEWACQGPRPPATCPQRSATYRNYSPPAQASARPVAGSSVSIVPSVPQDQQLPLQPETPPPANVPPTPPLAPATSQHHSLKE